MTKKEASFILANIDRRVCDDELNDALDMAIKSLEHITCAECEHYFFADNRIPEERCFICDYWGKDNQEPTGYCNHAVRKVRG